MASPTSNDQFAWEKEFAPKVSGRYLAFVSGLFALWMIFCMSIAFHRWFGDLQ